MTQLLAYLNAIHPLSSELNDYLIQTLKSIEIPKKEYILKEGHICYNIYFVSKGLARCFYMKEDKEVSSPKLYFTLGYDF